MKRISKILVINILTIFIMSGCSAAFSVGEENTYCREHGCSYEDVGVCANPVDILNNKDNLEGLDSKSLVRTAK